MNDKDKKEFEKWWDNYPMGKNITKQLYDRTKDAWQAALEYERFNHKYCVVGTLDKLCEKLEAENKKLREALQWYADRKNCDNPDFAHVEIDEHGEEIADGGYRAREALKEVGEK